MLYTETHETVDDLGNGIFAISISSVAKELLGDITYIDFPTVGDEYEAEEDLGVIESVKAASDFYAPFDCEVIEINEELEDDAELLEDSDAWICKVRLIGKMPALMTEMQYMDQQ